MVEDEAIFFQQTAFELIKDDCVQKCHARELLSRAVEHCGHRRVTCKANHGCAAKEVCKCKITFICNRPPPPTPKSDGIRQNSLTSENLHVFHKSGHFKQVHNSGANHLPQEYIFSANKKKKEKTASHTKVTKLCKFLWLF